jgi:hypothetical protein
MYNTLVLDGSKYHVDKNEAENGERKKSHLPLEPIFLRDLLFVARAQIGMNKSRRRENRLLQI